MTDHYRLKGRKVEGDPYHYTQCGLDDVYLVNGFTRHVTPHGEGVSVEKVEELQHAIALNLCSKAFLTGKEFRFMRKLMDLTQAQVAVSFGCDVQSVARWEKGKCDVNGAADRLLRLLYLASQQANISAEDFLEMVAAQDSTNAPQLFTETEDGWKVAA